MDIFETLNRTDRAIEAAVQAPVKAIGEWARIESKYNKALLIIISTGPGVLLGVPREPFLECVQIISISYLLKKVFGLIEKVLPPKLSLSQHVIKAHRMLLLAITGGYMLGINNNWELLTAYVMGLPPLWLYIISECHVGGNSPERH